MRRKRTKIVRARKTIHAFKWKFRLWGKCVLVVNI